MSSPFTWGVKINNIFKKNKRKYYYDLSDKNIKIMVVNYDLESYFFSENETRFNKIKLVNPKIIFNKDLYICDIKNNNAHLKFKKKYEKLMRGYLRQSINYNLFLEIEHGVYNLLCEATDDYGNTMVYDENDMRFWMIKKPYILLSKEPFFEFYEKFGRINRGKG